MDNSRTQKHNSQLFKFMGIFILTSAALAFCAETGDGATINASLQKIIVIVTKYIIPGLATLVIIKGGVDMMQGRPDALKTIIMAIIGLVISLAAGIFVASIQSAVS